jgi:flagellin
MALQINTNIGALMASSAASSVNRDMETSMNRLSTGLRVNAARDDAAGVAIASRLTAEIRGTNQAIRNASDGQAMIDTAEGAHSEIVNILQRMRELSVQAANDTNSDTDRSNLQAEMTALTSEIDRIATVTTWAGKTLLNGGAATQDLNGTSFTAASFGFQIGANTGLGDTVTVNIGKMDTKSLGVGGATKADIVNITGSAATGKEITFAIKSGAGNENTLVVGPAASDGSKDEKFSARIDGVKIEVTVGANGFGMDAKGTAAAFIKAVNDAKISGITASTSATAGEIVLTKPGSVSIASASAASTSIGLIDVAIKNVNTQRANLGAVSNRLDSTISNLTNISTNLEAGRSSIQDADFAAESTSLAKSQILQQASTAMLAQANASKQGVLQLLQG